MKVVVYLCSFAVTVLCIALAFEFVVGQLLPEAYRGYLIEKDGNVTWTIGPYEPAQKSTGFNAPVSVEKPDNTLRIISVGTSGTEGWLSARTVFNKYGFAVDNKDLSSYSLATEFVMNTIASPTSPRIEVINLGIAAYNITDVIRMLKDSLRLQPDFFVIQIGGNETWTAERTTISSFFDTDIPYLYSELAYELFGGLKGSWATLSNKSEAFNPYALFASVAKPVVIEPPGRSAGLEPRLKTYASELERLGAFLRRKEIPVLFLVPSQNLAGFLPFGSMAKPGTDPKQLEKLNQLVIEALKGSPAESKEKYLEILSLDDGIAEANFQLGTYYLQANEPDKARAHFWKANDRDLVLKRLPSAFHDISRRFIERNNFLYIDEMKLYESRTPEGVVGYRWIDDDVHPNREAQFDLGTEIAKLVVANDLLKAHGYSADLSKMPAFDNYNAWTNFDQEAAGKMAFIKAAHNYLSFGRFRQRLQWDPQPSRFLEPILADLDFANAYAPGYQSRSVSATLNLFLGRKDKAQELIRALNCRESAERSATVYTGMMNISYSVVGNLKSVLLPELKQMLIAEGCEE